MIMLLDVEPNTQTIGDFAEFTNRYGFMIVFSVVVLIVLVILFINHEKIAMKKQESDLESIAKERNANLEQNKKMFDLVTTVQTEQIIQLKEMTASLKDMNKALEQSTSHINMTNRSLEEINTSLKGHEVQASEIVKSLGEILTIVKTNEASNQEVLTKVSEVEAYLKRLYSEDNNG